MEALFLIELYLTMSIFVTQLLYCVNPNGTTLRFWIYQKLYEDYGMQMICILIFECSIVENMGNEVDLISFNINFDIIVMHDKHWYVESCNQLSLSFLNKCSFFILNEKNYILLIKPRVEFIDTIHNKFYSIYKDISHVQGQFTYLYHRQGAQQPTITSKIIQKKFD